MHRPISRAGRRLAVIAGLIAAALSLPAAAATQSLVILHDNDIHGHLREFCYIEKAKGPEEHCQIGGAARRATLIPTRRALSFSPLIRL